VVTTGGASDVTPFGATVSGSVNPLSNPLQFCRFEYGATTAYGSEAPCPSDPGSGSSPVPISAALQKLTPSTTYHYRLVAGNAGGTAMGSDGTFTTLPHDPTTTTVGVVNVLPDGAKLLGRVNAQGSVTSYRFEFGPSTAYGHSTPAGTIVGSTDEPVSAVLGSLVPNTAYHFRLAATNAGGTTYGADQTFTTLIRPVGHATIPARAGIKHGTIMIPLTCKGEAIAECTGTLTVRARIKKGIRFILVEIGSADYDFFGKQTKEIAVRLNGNGHKVLSQSEGKPVRAVASAGGANREMRLFPGGRGGSRHGRHHR
jgi:FlaG/FlaF family flagellin (archaellin)